MNVRTQTVSNPNHIRRVELTGLRMGDTSRKKQQPGPPTLEETLLIEVEHAEERLQAALRDLRNWRLSNPAGG